MSESPDRSEAPSSSTAGLGGEPSPGALLRALREKQGMHLGVLATTLKVSPRKLELLEADRFEELPDATFVKALALAICRALRADPTAVMAAYAARDLTADPFRESGKGLNAPMQAGGRGAAWVDTSSLPGVSRRVRWMVGLLSVIVIAVVAWVVWGGGVGAYAALSNSKADPPASAVARPHATAVPSDSLPVDTLQPVPAGASPTVPAAAGASVFSPALAASQVASVTNPGSGVVGLPPVALPSEPSQGAGGPIPAFSGATLKVSVSADSWLEVVDGARRVVWSQVVPEGESVQLTAEPPLQVVVGNARATRLEFAGQSVDLTAHVRGNVARLQVP